MGRRFLRPLRRDCSRRSLTLISPQRQSASDVKMLGCLYSTNSSGPNGPMNQREDYHEAIKIKKRKYEESGKRNTTLHPSEQVRQRTGEPFAWHSEGTERVDSKTGWKWYLSAASSSSSSSWWKSSEKWWQASSWDEQRFFLFLIQVSRCFEFLASDCVCKHVELPHTFFLVCLKC